MALILPITKFGTEFTGAYWKISAYRKDYMTGEGIVTLLVYASDVARQANPAEPLRGHDFPCTVAEVDALALPGATDDRDALYAWLKSPASAKVGPDLSMAIDG